MAPVTAQALVTAARRVVIKIGSALLVDAETGHLREDWLRGLADDVAAMKARGQDVVIVSSGSIALGRRVLAMGETLSLEQSQAAASVGQIRLARAYEAALSPHQITAAQVLVTLEDSADRRRYLNSRATLQTLLSLGCVPIVNENDTVATDEIRFGDNDRLAAQVAILAGADLCILFSDVDGLYSADPRKADATHFPVIETITAEIEAMAGTAASASSRGGMKTKVMAARTATAAGCAMVIAKGHVDRPVQGLEQGARSTVFTANRTPSAARKHWIDTMKPKGALEIDTGAVAALGRGKSLLPAGVTAVTGDFQRGDPINILGAGGVVVARGLASYGAAEADAIKGAQSSEIPAILGYPGRAALVHRDDLVMQGSET